MRCRFWAGSISLHGMLRYFRSVTSIVTEGGLQLIVFGSVTHMPKSTFSSLIQSVFSSYMLSSALLKLPSLRSLYHITCPATMASTITASC
jgi:hypothetical protein